MTGYLAIDGPLFGQVLEVPDGAHSVRAWKPTPPRVDAFGRTCPEPMQETVVYRLVEFFGPDRSKRWHLLVFDG